MSIGFAFVFAVIAAVLAVKVYVMKKSVREITDQTREKLREDTNTGLDVSTGDRDMRVLAANINTELKTLREEQRRYVRGDKELKDAITNISHDLRTPLTAICGYLDLLEKCPQSEEARQYLFQIKNRTEAMQTLTEELFRYSVAASEGKLSLDVVCVNDVLEESIASLFGAISERGIVPEINITETRITRITDKTALARIFSNILSNALKYSSGDLFVTMDENCVISFKNSAENIENIEVNRLFDRFYTVKSGNLSTGLGLSIAKLLTEKLGGVISAEIIGEMLEIRIRL